MTRVNVVVEGQTEESFINEVLASVFWPRNIWLVPIILGVPGRKGGRTDYTRVKDDVLKLLKQDKQAFCTTMLDLYGLGSGFPGTPLPTRLQILDKVRTMEQAVKADIVDEVPHLRADIRFLPYIQLHEYEGLLFSDPEAFARGIYRQDLASRFREIRRSFATPEDIDDGPDSAPSKRVIRLCPSYRKPLYGTLAAMEVGIDTMRQECPHFRGWVEQIEALGGGQLNPHFS